MKSLKERASEFGIDISVDNYHLTNYNRKQRRKIVRDTMNKINKQNKQKNAIIKKVAVPLKFKVNGKAKHTKP